jgi:hypothetical protein
MKLFRYSITCLSLLVSAWVIGQSDTLEIACDTAVFGHQYTVERIAPDGGIIAFGNRDTKGRMHGYWCFLHEDEKQRHWGRYKRDRRTGHWWFGVHLYVTYDGKGQIKRMEMACLGCPIF